MSVYEQAAERLRQHTDHALITTEDVVAVAAAVWDAIYCCPQCGGSNHDQKQFCPATAWVEEGTARPNEVGCHPCPAEHVVLTNPHNQEQRYCQPDKAEWRCKRSGDHRISTCQPGGTGPWRGDHGTCRWVPVSYEGSSE